MEGATTTETTTAATPTHPSSRPTLGFPLGTALLLVVIFSLSGVFSCCYHWDKVQSLRRCIRRAEADGETADGGEDEEEGRHGHGIPSPPSKNNQFLENPKQEKGESLPVIMPGNLIPTFMAWPCPCEPSLLPPRLPSPPLEVMVVDALVPTPRPLPLPLPRLSSRESSHPPLPPGAAVNC